MPQATFVNQIQKVGTTASLLPGQSAIVFDGNYYTVTNVPEGVITGTGGETITGYTLVTPKDGTSITQAQLTSALELYVPFTSEDTPDGGDGTINVGPSFSIYAAATGLTEALIPLVRWDGDDLRIGDSAVKSGLYGTSVTRPARVGQIDQNTGATASTEVISCDNAGNADPSIVDTNIATIVAYLNALEAKISAAGGGFGGTD